MLLVGPFPVRYFRIVCSVLVSVVAALDLNILEFGPRVCTSYFEFRHSVDYVHSDGEAIDLIIDCQLQRSVDIALLLVSTHMQVGMVVSVVRQAMNQPWIAVE